MLGARRPGSNRRRHPRSDCRFSLYRGANSCYYMANPQDDEGVCHSA